MYFQILNYFAFGWGGGGNIKAELTNSHCVTFLKKKLEQALIEFGYFPSSWDLLSFKDNSVF